MAIFHLAWRCAGPGGWRLIRPDLEDAPPCPIAKTTRLGLVSEAAEADSAVQSLAEAETPSDVLLALAPAAALSVFLDPEARSLTAAAGPGAWQYLRLADATLKMLPATPETFVCQPGDAYAAVLVGGKYAGGKQASGKHAAGIHAAGGEAADLARAMARFIHLRDYFNADKLAAAGLEHLMGLCGEGSLSAGMLVIELR